MGGGGGGDHDRGDSIPGASAAFRSPVERAARCPRVFHARVATLPRHDVAAMRTREGGGGGGGEGGGGGGGGGGIGGGGGGGGGGIEGGGGGGGEEAWRRRAALLISFILFRSQRN